jgi:hypothetical protein
VSNLCLLPPVGHPTPPPSPPLPPPPTQVEDCYLVPVFAAVYRPMAAE